MKLYKVQAGTKSIVITATKDGSNGSDDNTGYDDGRNFVTKKDNYFYDTVLDPVQLHNYPDATAGLPDKLVVLARAGYALFHDDDHPQFLLAVNYDEVQVNA